MQYSISQRSSSARIVTTYPRYIVGSLTRNCVVKPSTGVQGCDSISYVHTMDTFFPVRSRSMVAPFPNPGNMNDTCSKVRPFGRQFTVSWTAECRIESEAACMSLFLGAVRCFGIHVRRLLSRFERHVHVMEAECYRKSQDYKPAICNSDLLLLSLFGFYSFAHYEEPHFLAVSSL